MKKYLNRLDVFSIVVGGIIGWGSFMLPGTKFLKEAGVINTAIGLILGALCIIVIERNYEVMMSIQNEEGGEFSFTYNNLGKKHGFIVGWFLTLAYFTMIPLNATAFPLVIKKLMGGVLEFGYLYNVAGYNVYIGEIIAASIIILLFAYFNIKGLKESSRIQNIIIIVLISMVFLVFVGMLFKGERETFVQTYIKEYSFDINSIAMVFAITPFAFIGFDAIPQLSNEYKFSAKKASIVAITGLIIGTLIYNILNIITALAYTPKQALVLEWATGSAVLGTLGRGAFFMLIMALCGAVWSGINGFMICSSKLLGSVARYKMLPDKMGKINKNGVYKNAILFLTGISLIAPWFGREVIIWIVDMSSLGAAVAYLYVSYIAYRKTEKITGKVFSILGVIISIIFILLLLLPMSPAGLGKESMISLLIWSLMGIIFYFNIK
ncbi:APC family permease [Clostridium sp.]|uniref:APC family permease n=1 Tax=Clostridium sp. TaxID=1506 RepID=UPI0025BBDB24|nr:APC family permease [Clostridium sp.]